MILPAQLKQRQLIGEVMDQPDLEPKKHIHALRGLTRINQFSSAVLMVSQPIQRLARELKKPLRILDLATGAGDLPIALSRMGKRKGLQLQVEGCDKSDTALQFARESALRQKAHVNFFQLDLVDEEIPAGFDVVLCSLFLHHLDNRSVIGLLQRIRRRVDQMVIVSDLRRSYSGYLLALAATRMLTRSSVVHTDGPLSVRAAFTISEIEEIAKRAGLEGFHLEKKWPFRYLLTWNRK